jgi:hypothetical protein
MIKLHIENIYWKLRGWFWDSLWFNRKKMIEFLDNIPEEEIYESWDDADHTIYP